MDTSTERSIYKVWHNMRRRCNNPAVKDFAYYGGRGITVCSEWSDFAPFLDWAIASGYQRGLQLDREDNDGGYSPSNCRWVTPAENTRNRRVAVMVTAFGETKNTSVWAEDPRCVVTGWLLRNRIHKGWPGEPAITSRPKITGRPRKTQETTN